MIKTIGIVILCVSIFLLGIIYYEKYKKRYRSIALFCEILNKYSVELKLHCKTISEIICEFDNNSKYIKESKRLIRTNTLYDTMIGSNRYFDELFLINQDIMIISNFFRNCGKGGYKTENELCINTLIALEKLKNDSLDNFKKSGPFVIKLSVICAVWVFIVLV